MINRNTSYLFESKEKSEIKNEKTSYFLTALEGLSSEDRAKTFEKLFSALEFGSFNITRNQSLELKGDLLAIAHYSPKNILQQCVGSAEKENKCLNAILLEKLLNNFKGIIYEWEMQPSPKLIQKQKYKFGYPVIKIFNWRVVAQFFEEVAAGKHLFQDYAYFSANVQERLRINIEVIIDKVCNSSVDALTAALKNLLPKDRLKVFEQFSEFKASKVEVPKVAEPQSGKVSVDSLVQFGTFKSGAVGSSAINTVTNEAPKEAEQQVKFHF